MCAPPSGGLYDIGDCETCGWTVPSTTCSGVCCSALRCAVVRCLPQLLDRDLEEAEEQHQAALRSHLMVLDSLLDLQV